MEKCEICGNEIDKNKDISIITKDNWNHIDCWFGELCNHLKSEPKEVIQSKCLTCAYHNSWNTPCYDCNDDFTMYKPIEERAGD